MVVAGLYTAGQSIDSQSSGIVCGERMMMMVAG